MTDQQQAEIKAHVLPADGKEAVAIALCGRRAGATSHRLLVNKIIPVPYEACSIREANRVSWSTDLLIPLLGEASRRRMAIVKIHGHPQNYPWHSEVDDESDRELFPSIYGWMEDDNPHASAIMLPNEQIIGRIVSPEGMFESLNVVKVVGEDLKFYYANTDLQNVPEFAKRTAQTFGEETFAKLKRLKVGIVGCSGTGSWVIEQLGRYGVGTLDLLQKSLRKI
ncbi:MAG: ThiF family adenylyltransferase [Nostoc sp.]